ncbi:MAG: 50S ribosomal protein L23 [Candidatus Omnitrophica bacterium]|nr:50S ribosomal protein L23 [Candidatus Omnitrophota bacterium]
MRLHLYDIIVEPLITEKATGQKEAHKYSFRVRPDANKKSVKEAVEKIFNVHVTKVNTILVSGKWKRVRVRPGLTADWKKATVTIKEGEKIEFV